MRVQSLPVTPIRRTSWANAAWLGTDRCEPPARRQARAGEFLVIALPRWRCAGVASKCRRWPSYRCQIAEGRHQRLVDEIQCGRTQRLLLLQGVWCEGKFEHIARGVARDGVCVVP